MPLIGTPAFEDGVDARKMGKERSTNPYIDSTQDQLDWFNGYDEEQSRRDMDLLKIDRATNLRKG